MPQTVMAYVGTAYKAMAKCSYGLYIHGICSYGLDSCGLDSYGLDSYGLYGYGLQHLSHGPIGIRRACGHVCRPAYEHVRLTCAQTCVAATRGSDASDC